MQRNNEWSDSFRAVDVSDNLALNWSQVQVTGKRGFMLLIG